MKNYRTSAILYYAAAVLFYVSAALNFLSDNGNTMGILWFVVGSVYVCLGDTLHRNACHHGDNFRNILFRNFLTF